ncbi:MAG: hypothetical protein K8T91_16810, partial [Planctomycetes bacterium]|nr:hypothetical protein [Planctomycetota bacterium]
MMYLTARITQSSGNGLLWMVVMVALLTGCRSAEPRSWHSEDLEPQREQRKAEAVARFEAQRDEAQFAAALSRFKIGDIPGCRKSLEALMVRNPKHKESRELLLQIQELQECEGGDISTAAWESTPGKEPQVAPVGAALPLSLQKSDSRGEGNRPQHDHITDVDGEPDTYVRSTDQASASLCVGPASSAKAQRRIPVYRADTTNYDGNAWGDVAKRSVRQAIEALAVGDFEGAATYYRAAAAAEPGNSDLLLAAAAMSLRYEQDELALELVQSAISLYPSDAAAQRTLATIYYRQSN